MRFVFLLLVTFSCILSTTAVFTPWDCDGEMCQLVKRDANVYTTVDWDVPRPPRAFRFRFQPGIRW